MTCDQCGRPDLINRFTAVLVLRATAKRADGPPPSASVCDRKGDQRWRRADVNRTRFISGSMRSSRSDLSFHDLRATGCCLVWVLLCCGFRRCCDNAALQWQWDQLDALVAEERFQVQTQGRTKKSLSPLHLHREETSEAIKSDKRMIIAFFSQRM